HRPQYTPHHDTGEYVIVINAEKVKFTGKKWQQKTYAAYSHYPGGLKVQTAEDVLAKHPERILEAAVRRMVPRNRLGRKQMDKLNRVDMIVKVEGGGITGQAGAISQGTARALKSMFGQSTSAETDGEAGGGIAKILRDSGFLTRDGRMKERKKYGKKGARKSF